MGDHLDRQTSIKKTWQYARVLVSRDKIVFRREYFDPTRSAKALNTLLLDLEPW